ncbi:ABC transporter permease subunit [Berryella wangjianweii]|uniref:ABC transporter permease subunit n=1 Tax=Berryella wangjianweii TaxID=2734634 RepID=A0A6M8J768_9ACTN|nr:ABC transporter permease subunit [Berryella wangjianweii]QKF07249.1 ABC transporter permease subunit [Berryella wangjianweii]
MTDRIVRIWAAVSTVVVLGCVAFLFAYLAWQGGHVITPAFLTQAPRGAVLGEEGGIFPAIVGSLWFVGVSVLVGGLPAFAVAVYLVHFCRSRAISAAIDLVVRCIAGIPSIVLGLFAYSLLVRDAGWGRSVLSAGVALGIMVMPYIETRMEKALREVPSDLVMSARALGYSKVAMLRHVALPACAGDLAGALVLGACFSMGATAPLMFTGGVAFASVPTTALEPAMALPLHLYLLVAQGATSMDAAYGTALTMMAIVLAGNLAAGLLVQRSRRAWNRF